MLCRCEIATRDRSHDSRMLVYETLDRVGLASTEEIHLAGNHSHLDTEVIIAWELIIEVTGTRLDWSTRHRCTRGSSVRGSSEWRSTSCEDCAQIICESAIREIAHGSRSTRNTTGSSDSESHESGSYRRGHGCHWTRRTRRRLFYTGCRCTDRTRIPEE